MLSEVLCSTKGSSKGSSLIIDDDVKKFFYKKNFKNIWPIRKLEIKNKFVINLILLQSAGVTEFKSDLGS